MTPSTWHGADGVGIADTAPRVLVRRESNAGGFSSVLSPTQAESWVSGEERTNSSHPQNFFGPGYPLLALEPEFQHQKPSCGSSWPVLTETTFLDLYGLFGRSED